MGYSRMTGSAQPGMDTGILVRSQFRGAHIYGNGFYQAVFCMEPERFDAGEGFYCDHGFICHFIIINIFSHAADAVPAHFAFGAVSVIHGHSEIRYFGRTDTDQAIGSDAKNDDR